MRKLYKKFLNDTSGQFAVMTSIFAVPLILCVGVAIDSAVLHNKTAGLQSALDSAALAAVIPGNMTNSEREDYAKEIFLENFTTDDSVTVDVVATPSRVDITGTLKKKTIFMGINGSNAVKQSRQAAAVKTVEDVICVMTLNNSSRGSLTFEKNAKLNTPHCSVQVNSSDNNALIASGNYVPSAKRICVHGGVNGNSGPNTQANCSALEDPYAHVRVPKFSGDTAECNYGPLEDLAVNAISTIGLSLFAGFQSPGTVMTPNVDDALDQFNTSFAVGEVDGVRYPGVYCGGMHFYDSSVTLMPGTYYMQDGPLTFGAGSEVVGEGVTFVFSGEGSYLYTYDDAAIKFSAPKRGDYAGLIFFQDRNSSADASSIIKGNANIKLIGTAYFPTQDLFVGGLGVMGADSPAMAFIADNITFTSDIDNVISRYEAEFQEYKTMIEIGADLLYQFGYSDYQVKWDNGGNKNTHYTDFTTTVKTSIGSSAATGIPFAQSDGGARLVSSTGSAE